MKDRKMIYLDYSANTPASENVLETYIKTERTYIGNANAAHFSGFAAKARQDEITENVAALLNVGKDEIIYTSGASESNNLAIKGIARSSRHIGKHIITTPLEHPSVSAPLTFLQEQGYEVDMVRIGTDGKIDVDDLRSLLRHDTVLLTVSAVDSELGVIQPINEIRDALKDYPHCSLHVDFTQAVGKIPCDFSKADTASFAPHKFYGLGGSGALYKKSGLVIEPLIHGGSGTTVYRSGTPTLALNAALEEALRDAVEKQGERYEKVQRLNSLLRERLSRYDKVCINSPEGAIPHILNISASGIKGSDFRDELSKRGICVSVKTACSTDSLPSRAVFAVSRDRKNALSSFRISLGHITSEDEIESFMKEFDAIYREKAK